MSSKSILVVDDDPEVITTLRAFLRDKGYDVSSATDGIEGLKKAKELQPDVILLDVKMPNMDGWTLIRQLRILPMFTFTPVIFLSLVNDGKSRKMGFQLGADDYVDKKYIFDELIHRIEKVSAAAHMYKRSALLEVKSMANHNTSFTGRLEDFGIASLVSLCRMEKASGVLVLESVAGQHGMVYLKDGDIVAAKATGQQVLKNELAIFSIMSWDSGTFELNKMGTDNIPQEISRTTDSILLEAASRLDEGVLA